MAGGKLVTISVNGYRVIGYCKVLDSTGTVSEPIFSILLIK
jgi:hypothetical protein